MDRASRRHRRETNIILLPEIPFEWEKVANAVRQRDADGYKCPLIVVAEGAKPKDGEQSYHHSTDGEYRLGGIGEIVTAEVAARTGKESRCCVRTIFSEARPN